MEENDKKTRGIQMKTPWNWVMTLAMLGFTAGAPYLETAHTTNDFLQTIQALPTDSSCQDYVALVPERSQPAVVLQVVSKEYLALELNFIRQMELHSTFSRHNLYIICLDETSATFLSIEMGIHCAESLHGGDGATRQDVWVLRVQVASCLLLAGYDVLLSDADAIWLRDPMESIRELGVNDSSVVASRGRFPRGLFVEWGSTVCFGFVLFRAKGSNMPTLVDSLIRHVTQLKDDQRAMNSALSELGIRWDPKSDMEFEDSTKPGRGTVRRLAHGDEAFVVTLLPHATFTRLCDSTPLSEDTVVAHCLSRVKGEGMDVWMKEANLWEDFDPATRQFSPP